MFIIVKYKIIRMDNFNLLLCFYVVKTAQKKWQYKKDVFQLFEKSLFSIWPHRNNADRRF